MLRLNFRSPKFWNGNTWNKNSYCVRMVSEKLSPKISDPLQKWIIPLTYPFDHDYFMNHLNDESEYANINLYFILRIVFLTHPFSHSILHLTHPLLARSTFTFSSGMWNKFTLWIETDCNNKYLSKMEMLQQAILYFYVTHYWCAERLCHYASPWNFHWGLVTTG